MEDLKKHIENGCGFGQSNGPDSICKDCDCEERPSVGSIQDQWKKMDKSVDGLRAARMELEKLMKG